MAHTGIHSTDAKRYVKIAQFAGVGLGVLAAALWVTDVPGLSRTLPSKPPIPGGLGDGMPIATVTQVSRIEPSDPPAIQERLDSAVKRAKPVEPPKPEEPQAEPVVPPTGPVWRYLGPIREATRTLALVSIDGTQKIVSEGSTVALKTPPAEGRPESTTYQANVTLVDLEYIEIEESGRRRRIDLDARTAKVAWVKNMPTAVAGATPNVAALSAETRQRLAAQGIDPVAAERARLAAMSSAGAGRNRALPNASNTPNFQPGNVTTTVGGITTSKGGAPTDQDSAASPASSKSAAPAKSPNGKKARSDAEAVN